MLKNQVRNEIFRQMSLTLTLTLPLDVPVRPMNAKGLISTYFFIHSSSMSHLFWTIIE